MDFKKVNNISGWIIFLIAMVTYVSSMEPTASLWDCGEFILTAYKLQVAHAPGAPLFMMLGRIFTLFASDVTMVAAMVNLMSATVSAFTILFLYWSITHFARKIVVGKNNEALTSGNIFSILGAGTVGALAYAFSDTFWFSAVEGEVYAMSSFFTAVVFWAALKWEDQSEDPRADRWMILIFYLMGLSIGVHLLNLLTIPAIIMVYYFKRYTPSVKGGIYAFFVGCIALAIVQFGVIQFLPIIASQFELIFVNSFHLPFNSGLFFFIASLVIAIIFVLRFAKKKGKVMLHTCVLALTFVIIGYSSFVAVVLRSKADVPIDMGNPDNVISLIPYLQRDQYGSQPIATGPYFTSKLIEIKKDRNYYAAMQDDQGRDFYKEINTKPKYVFDKNYFFPRIWSSSQESHVQFYRGYLGLGQNEDPTAIDNIKFFMGYQLNWMYWRYFMWNYVGRQNDIEGQGEAQNGNWISGIKFIDKMFGKGDADLMPDDMKNNKARNEYYFLPFILGIVGLVYHYKKDKQDFIVVGLFFFFTGIAIQMYINNTPLQPRERDYAYVSTYAFAMWIGLGVLAITNFLNKKMKSASVAAPALATLVALVAVPGLMLAENWDDHDRSEKTIAKNHARNMLASLDKNAILITYGDNDTYPLWFLQEIEGFRRDVRIVNVNLLGTDWQNDQLTYKVNESDAVPMIWNKGEYLGRKLEYSYIVEHPGVDKNAFFKIDDVIKYVANPKNHQFRQGDSISIIPTRNFLMKIDKNAVIKAGLVDASRIDLIPEEIAFKISKNGLSRGDLSILNMLAGQMNNGFTRPIYMCEGVENFGLDEFFKNEGPVRKFVPERSTLNIQGLSDYANVDKNIKIFNEFEFGGANGDHIYYDEKNQLIFLTYRQKVASFASYLSIIGRQADAKNVLDNFMAKISETSLPYTVNNLDRGSILQVIEAYYRAGDKESAAKYGQRFLENINANIKYFKDLGPKLNNNSMNVQMMNHNMQMANYLLQVAQQYGDNQNVQKWAQEAGLQAPVAAPQAIQQATEIDSQVQVTSESDTTNP